MKGLWLTTAIILGLSAVFLQLAIGPTVAQSGRRIAAFPQTETEP